MSTSVTCSAETNEQEKLTVSPTASGEMTKLLRHSSHYFAGLMAKLSLGFISLPVFARVFSVADYGLIDLVQKILLLVTAMSKMGLQNSALRFFDETKFGSDLQASRRYYSTMFYGALLTSTIVAIGFLFVTKRPIVATLIDAPVSALMGFVAILVVLRAMESILWSFLRIEERTMAYNLSSAAVKLLTITIVCLFLWLFGRSVRIFFWGSTLSEFVFVLILSGMLFRREVLGFECFDASLLRTSLIFGCPLIVYELSGIILDAGDRFMVRHYLGPSALGLYSVAYSLAAQVNDLLIFPLGLAVFPIYMKLWTTSGPTITSEFLSECLDIFLMVSAGVCALVTVASRDGLILLASSKYRGAEHLIPIIVIGLLLYTTHVFLCAGLLIHKKTLQMATLLICAAAFNIALNMVLLPRMGLMGAAVATLISYAFCICVLGHMSVRYLPLKMRFRALATYATIAATLAIVISRIELPVLVVNLAVRCALVVILYAISLYLLDQRVQRIGRRFVTRPVQSLISSFAAGESHSQP